jgi:PAS domain S-box-containing protein
MDRQTQDVLRREEAHNLLADYEQPDKSLVDILDTLPSIIAMVDRDGRVDLVNRRFEQFSGVSAANAQGMLIESLIPRFSGQLQRITEAIELGEPVNIEKIKLRNGKDPRYYSLQIYPLNEEPSGMAVIRIDDISEHVRIEEIMMQTEKMMMAGGLAAGLAQEINDPLGVIMQHSQNIERRISPNITANLEAARELGISLDDVRAYLEKRGIPGFIGHIREAGARASRIITAMLHFSRRSEPFTESADIAAVFDQALELAANDYDLNKKCNFKNIEIVRECDPAVPPVTMTVLEIEHVFLNIIRNAAQAMAEKCPRPAARITVRIRRDGEMALIEIEDNGPGLEETLQHRIFEPFFTTKPVGMGTGLGLSVSYAIITNNHKGSIEVSSQPDEGTRFTIRLPIKGKTA